MFWYRCSQSNQLHLERHSASASQYQHLQGSPDRKFLLVSPWQHLRCPSNNQVKTLYKVVFSTRNRNMPASHLPPTRCSVPSPRGPGSEAECYGRQRVPSIRPYYSLIADAGLAGHICGSLRRFELGLPHPLVVEIDSRLSQMFTRPSFPYAETISGHVQDPSSVALSSPLCPSPCYHRPTSASHLSPLGHRLGIGRSDHTTTEDENPASGFGNCHRQTPRVNPIYYCATACSGSPRAVSLEFIGDDMQRCISPPPIYQK